MPDFASVDPFLAGGPLALAGTLLGFVGWPREMGRRKKRDREREVARRRELLANAALLRTLDDQWRRASGRGQLPLLSCGTYGSRQLPYILEAFRRADAVDHVGPILLLELDNDEREICLRQMPEEFRDRVVTIGSVHHPGGYLGDPPELVWADRDRWWIDVEAGAKRWLARIQAETDPVSLPGLISPGGSAVLAQPVLELLHQRYPDLPVYLTSVLDHKTVVRRRFPQIRQLYGLNGYVRGTVLGDNRRDHQAFDVALATLYAAMVGATWIDQQPLQLWNAFAYLFPREHPGGYATLSAWGETLPVRHLPAWEDELPESYYTRAGQVEEKLLRGIKAVVENAHLQSMPLDAAGPGNTRICYVITPMVPDPDLRRISERVDASLASWRAARDPDLLIHYASIATPLHPDATEAPLLVVLVQPLADRGEQIDALALGSHEIDPKFTLASPADGYMRLAAGKEA